MTAQIRERLIYKGKEMGMDSEPLSQYLSILKEKLLFVSPTTACWRGYYGKWELRNNKLFLIDFKGYIEDYMEVGMDYIFPGQKEVFADWFNGLLKIPQGEMLEYIHMGYASVHEEDLFLELKDGIHVNSRVVNNRNRRR